MDNTKFTKGIWVINPKALRNVRCNNLTIANCSSGQNGENEIEEKANALLISKAPEMLEMLKEVVTTYDNERLKQSITMARVIDRAEQLIKEATEL
jgi:hypothetical protein